MTPLLVAALAAGHPVDTRPAGPLFVAHAAGAEPQPGKLVRLADSGATFADPDATVGPGKLVALRRPDRPTPRWPRDPHLVLANGDRVAGTVTGGERLTVGFAPAEKFADSWTVPLAAVAVWWVVPPPADTPPDPANYPWAAKKQDTVLLRTGDTLTGTVEGVAANGKTVRVVADPAQPPRVVAITDVAAVAFDPALARVRKLKGVHARLVTAGGSRVTLTGVASDGKALTGTTPFGAKLSVPLADVVALDVVGGAAVDLADLKPTAVVEGFNGVGWPWAANRTVKGHPLRLPGPDGDTWFDRGLGTHPKTTLTYPLGGKYRHFEAVVGLDPVTGKRGTAVVRVLLDGKERAVEGLAALTLAKSPVAVRLDVSGAKELTLVVDFGPAGDVQADVNWGDARLIE